MADSQLDPAATDKGQQSAALVTHSNKPRDVTGMLAHAAAHWHLVSPATAVSDVPEGCSVSLSKIMVMPAETYPIPGSNKLGLAKSALDRIAMAAGVHWDPRLSGRVDDGRDPHVCTFVAVGTFSHFDGSAVTVQGTKHLDLRNRSPMATRILETAKRNGKDGAGQLRDMRAFLLEHAETRARLRAIRSMGVRTSYTPDELAKPFVVAKLSFTGASDDPEMRREFSRMRAQKMLGMYEGNAPSFTPIARLPLSAATSHGTPTGPYQDDDDDETLDGFLEEPATSPTIPSRKGEPRVAIADATNEALSFWACRLTEDLAASRSRYPKKDRACLAAVNVEIARRAVADSDAEPKGAA